MEIDDARQVLGLPDRVTIEDVRAAYRRLLRAHHPDVARDRVGADGRTATLIDAYES